MIARKINRRPIVLFHSTAIFGFVVLGLFTIFILYPFHGEGRLILSNVITEIINILAIIALSFAAVRSAKKSKRVGICWGFFAAAQLSLLFADVTLLIYEVVLGIPITSSFLSGLYLFYYPLFMIGILLMPVRAPVFMERQKRFLDIFIVMVAAVMGYLNFLIGPLVVKSVGGDPMTTILSIGMQVGDLMLLGLAFSFPNRITEKHN